MATSFRKLKVLRKIDETGQAQSILFDRPDDGDFDYSAGQYLTLKFELDGKEHRRAYSIFTPPGQSQFGFTVKRVKGGLISNHLIDKVQEGSIIEVMPPEGKFVIEPHHQVHRDHFFVAAGSGITPIMSMIEHLLESEPLSSCYLLYGNKDEDNIIFRTRLAELAERFQGQLYVVHTLSQPKQVSAGGLKGLFGKKAESAWKGWRGRIDAKLLSKFLDEHPSKSGDNSYYLCGPGGMIELVESGLIGRDVAAADIHKEYFTAASDGTGAATTAMSGSCEAEVKLNGKKFSATIPADKTILDALIDLGKDPPYSCTSGACSTCVAKVISGEVEMEACFALDDEEIEDGYVLTCQSKCKTANLVIDFES